MIAQCTAGGREAANGSSPPSDDDAVSRKRMRVSRACDACRRRKERCDGAQPSCHRCTTLGRPCWYNPNRKRGLRTGYVRGAEILLGLLISASDGAEDLILSVLLNKAAGQASSQTRHTAAPTSSSLLEVWRNSTALQDLQNFLTASEAEEDEESYLQGLDAKLTAAFNGLPRQNNQLNIDAPSDSMTQEHFPPPVSIPSPPLTSSLLSTTCQTVQTENLSSASTAPWGPNLPSNWSQLVQIYVAHTHNWLPIIQKYTLFRSANLLSGVAAAVTRPDSSEILHPGDIVSLWAALSLGSYQLEAARQAGTVMSLTYGHSSVVPTPEQIYATAKDLAMQDPVCFDAGHIQAFLILALVEIGQGSCGKAWLWVGRAVYTATNLGIAPGPNVRSTQPLDDTKKRLFLGCFVLDNLLALKLGHRPYLNASDLHRVGRITFDGLEEWETLVPVFGMPTDAPCAAQPIGPSRILSTFDRFGSLIACLSRVHLAYSATVSPHELREITNEFSSIEQSRPVANVSVILSRGEPLAQEAEPLHLLQCKVLAAVAYVRIKLEIAGSPLEMQSSFQDAIDRATQPDLLETLSMLKSTPKLSPFFTTAWSPTLHILLDVLDQIGASSSGFYLRPDFAEPRQQAEPTCGLFNTQYLTFVPQEADITAGEVRQSRHSIATHRSSNLQTPTVSEETHATQGQGVTIRDQPTAKQRPEELTRSGPNSSQVNQTTKSPPERTQCTPLPVPPTRGDVNEGYRTTLPAATVVAASPVAESVDDGALFDQLALLDTADCRRSRSASSADFMEHLGLSRHGPSFDLNSLFS